jgi:hypothetical protein
MLIWFKFQQVQPEHRMRKRRSSDAAAATIVIEVSSSSDVEALGPYDNDAKVEEAYDADSIIDECVRPVAPEHVSMCNVAITNPCTHYLVKWAGYPASNSSWTPAFLCSKSLVELYQQQQSRIPHVASDAVRPSAPPGQLSASDQQQHSSISVPATAPGVPKKMPKLLRVQHFDDVSKLSEVPITTIQQLKTRISVLNPDCRLRTRGRDRRVLQGGDIDTVRLGCKHVDAAHPCPLQIYYDVAHGSADAVPTNFRRYIAGACTSNVCICCMCPLSHDKLVYLFFPCFYYYLTVSRYMSVRLDTGCAKPASPLWLSMRFEVKSLALLWRRMF